MPNPLLSLASSTARILPAPIRHLFYRLGPFTRLIRRSLNRAAPTGLNEVSIAAGTLKGYLFQLDMQTEKDYWLGNYETNLEAAIRDWLKPDMLVYDVGANIGYVSLLMTHTLGKTGQVFAFEALPANVERLKTNVALNHLHTQIHVIHAAVVETPASVPFLVHPSNGMGKAAGSAGRKEHYLEEILVPGTSLDHFVYDLGNPPPQAVKMDIEGGEILALPGMRRLLTEVHPLIFLELHGEAAAHTAWHTLTEAGYRLYRMAPGYPHIPVQEALAWKEYVIGVNEGDGRQVDR
jgi:FkbM family methyltransferase